MSASRVVAITGAAGEIGRALAARFARERARIALLDRTSELAARDEAQVRAAGAADVLALGADQTRRDSVEAAFRSIHERFGRLDVVIANAGFARFGGFLEMDPKTWDLHVNVNLSGTFHVCQVAARQMAAARRGGAIIVTSSCLALFHSDQVGAYCATKAALLMLVRTMAAELGAHGIRANAVLPGVIETDMTRGMLDRGSVRQELVNATPVGRLGTPDDVASAAAFLASTEAGFISGASLPVDGGQSIYNLPTWYRQDRSVAHEPAWVPCWEKS